MTTRRAAPKPPQIPSVAVCDLDALSPGHRAQLVEAGLDSLAPVECWAVEGTNAQNAYATHGLFRYFGKYPPPIGRKLILEHTAPGDLVLDPMCGSGTTGVEALLLGRRAALHDVSPLSAALARAKTTHVPLADSEAALAEIQARYSPATVDQYPVEPRGLRNPDHWFLPETADSLRGLHRAIAALPAGRPRALAEVAFLASIRRVSRATTQQGRLFLDVLSALPDAWPTFEGAMRRAMRAVDLIPDLDPLTISLHDARTPLPTSDPAELVILHPPYFNAYRYSRVNSLELAWTDTPPKALRTGEVREFFKVGKPENASLYADDMAVALACAADAARPGGVVAMMIGDARLKGALVPATRMILDRLRPEAGLSLVKVALRLPRHTEATWVASQRRNAGALGVQLCDYVLTFRKAGP